MEDPSTTTDSVSIPSDIAPLRRLQSDPDVPDDIDDDIMLHFNDPNWDFRDNSSTLSISTDGAESQRWSTTSGRTGTVTEVKTESRISTWHVHDAKADFPFREQIQLRVLSLPFRVPFCSPRSSSPGIHLTPRFAQPSQILTTQRCQ
jgi:hypothetical protein